ncbi:MAG: cysteine--tRNA ligase [Candidatus Moraniibacteriota bacterium]|nr:MAG: cysteine--tRNA ligase [Candidatus Moranbacteria bacterium]
MLQLYNTFTKQKEEFVPLNPGKVSMYTCGPTVYSYIHIGNLRAYTNADLLRRYLEYKGFEVRHIKNITDVGHLTDDDIAQGDSGDDKMLKAAKKEQKTPEEIARFYESYAKETEVEMNILPAHFFPRATEHIPQMISLIEKLIQKGYAYEKNGNIFFNVETFKDYGKLSGNTLENLNIGARLEDPHPDKKSQWDFALWLKAPKDHIMKWNSPWSVGYPGWHIECSAMSMEYLGATFDIHTGGEDNIFPHHEAEIAQSECANGVKFVNYWIHNRHLLTDGEKMSKSRGNLYTLEDIKNKGFSATDLRIIYLLSHYRSQMNFTWDTMQQARKNRKTLENFLKRLNAYTTNEKYTKNIDIKKYKKEFEEAMDDDLNSPLALTTLFALITETNSALDDKNLANGFEILQFTKKVLHALGIKITETTENISKEIKELAEKREHARANNNFETSDKIRDQINKLGYDVKDSPEGYELIKK